MQQMWFSKIALKFFFQQNIKRYFVFFICCIMQDSSKLKFVETSNERTVSPRITFYLFFSLSLFFFQTFALLPSHFELLPNNLNEQAESEQINLEIILYNQDKYKSKLMFYINCVH